MNNEYTYRGYIIRWYDAESEVVEILSVGRDVITESRNPTCAERIIDDWMNAR